MERVWTWLGSFGCVSSKPLVLHTNMPKKIAEEMLKKKQPKNKRQVCDRRSGYWSGGKKLKATGAYTKPFAKALLGTYMRLKDLKRQ